MVPHQTTLYLQNFGYYIQGAQWSRTGLYYPTRSLRSSNLMLLKVPPTNPVSNGDLALSVAAPKLWNSVPYEIRTAENLNLFKSKLKTPLFCITYF